MESFLGIKWPGGILPVNGASLIGAGLWLHQAKRNGDKA